MTREEAEAVAMNRLKFVPAFEAAIRSADPDKLAALRETIRERGGPDEFVLTSTELIRKHPPTLFRLLRIISDAAHEDKR
ncbi:MULTISPECIES: hypothetical protein [Bradyrhizobium]|uniref:hypothetical protein n=1 Tax=Bradyrhizobium TaxID=374 RepID=UPI000D65BA6D|nr:MULTISPECIES: hypothetical protein [Bradyrhizobium]MCA1416559.1 hypothetical protein [Bradyrhizobium sp. NBAIM20]MCA1466183.1 hypothetical protein [Bradyrhizobium sp. NBAIM18]MCA1530775.1 hypothetical protein [Bradyrhizobium yuanmingense]PWE75436.1 hypothetical protein XF30_00350 [Bradyrhizobium sp. SUTN9-2]